VGGGVGGGGGVGEGVGKSEHPCSTLTPVTLQMEKSSSAVSTWLIVVFEPVTV